MPFKKSEQSLLCEVITTETYVNANGLVFNIYLAMRCIYIYVLASSKPKQYQPVGSDSPDFLISSFFVGCRLDCTVRNSFLNPVHISQIPIKAIESFFDGFIF
jgi:hypothetical protein